MKSLRRTGDRLALLFAILAAVSVGAGVFGALATDPSSQAWIYPMAGLVGYVLCAKKAMSLWQGRGRTLPRRPIVAVWSVSAGLLAVATAPAAQAQQTIFNVPSADVLDKGKTYLELDALWRPQEPNFAVFTGRGVYGVGSHLEVGVNLGGFVSPGRSVPIAIAAVKWQPLKIGGFALTTGAHGLFYLRGSEDGDPAAHLWAHAAYAFPTNTRITAGGWVASDGYGATDPTRGGLFAIEQKVQEHLNLNADWYTGENGLGYFTPGVASAWAPWTIYAAYSFKNGDSKGNAMLLELGFTF